LTQLLPGPSSSQTSFLIGLARRGIPGGLAAWLGFTLPSAILMVVFAVGVRHVHGRAAEGALHGLQVAAVAVIANAVLSMFRRLCPDLIRAFIAFAAAAFVLYSAGSVSQIAVVLAGAAIGSFVVPEASIQGVDNELLVVSYRTAAIALVLFVLMFAAAEFQPLLLAFYRTGSLVFGGGHIVLPLLEQAVVRPGWVSESDFLAGYGAVQALPGPMFTFAAYLGYVSRISPNGMAGALLCLIAIFLPGLLLAVVAAPFWQRLRRLKRARSLIAGVNAAVVGLLISALVHAGLSGALRTYVDAAFGITGLVVLARTRVSPVVVVLSISCSIALISALVPI
jgi:chromate transporter